MRFLIRSTLTIFVACLMAGGANAQMPKDKSKVDIRALTSKKPVCPPLEEAVAVLDMMDKSDVYRRLIRDVRAKGDMVCAKKAKEAGGLLVDLLIATVRQDVDEVCSVTQSKQGQDLLYKMIQISQNSGGYSPCEIMKR